MNRTYKRIAGFCARHKLFSKHDSILVAISGGGDSVGLLHVLTQLKDNLGIELEAAHLNHSLRGDESDRDERFCREICARLNVKLTVEKLGEGAIAGKKTSIETAARDVRQTFLEHTMLERGMTKTALGHTIDDQVETILQRIIRGTGPSGLQGILPKNGRMVRPLLCVTRAEIRELLGESGIEYIEDSTNSDTSFFRNRIRHELIPFIQSRFLPEIYGPIVRLGELSQIQETYLREQALIAFNACAVHADNYKILLDKAVFMGYHKALMQRIVRHCLEQLEGQGRDTDMDEIENILTLAGSESGISDVTSNIRCEASKKSITFALRSEQFRPIMLNIPGETVLPMDNGVIVAEKADVTKRVDGKMNIALKPGVIAKYGKLTAGQLNRGERISPFGKKKEVKIRDIMSETAVPRILRDTLPVIRAGATAVWIPGLRSSELLRDSDNSGIDDMENESLILRFMNGIQW